MAQMETSYSPNAVTTQTSGAPQFQVPDNSEFMRFAYEMARRRLQAQQSPRMAPMSAGPRPSASDYARPPSPSIWGAGPTGDDALLEGMQKRQAIMDLEQAGRPAPQRLVHGAQINPGFVNDPSQMSASQRRMFLPQSAAFSGPIGRIRSAGEDLDRARAIELAFAAQQEETPEERRRKIAQTFPSTIEGQNLY